MMGNYHFGSVKALLETDLLPHIISGTSAGSVIGAMVCTRTDEELIRDLKPEILAPKMSIFESSWGQRLSRAWKHGTMFDQDDWYRRVQWFTCGEMTFEEAFKKTGRVFRNLPWSVIQSVRIFEIRGREIRIKRDSSIERFVGE